VGVGGGTGQPLPALQHVSLGTAIMGRLDFVAPALLSAVVGWRTRPRILAGIVVAVAAIPFGQLLHVVQAERRVLDLAGRDQLVRDRHRQLHRAREAEPDAAAARAGQRGDGGRKADQPAVAVDQRAAAGDPGRWPPADRTTATFDRAVPSRRRVARALGPGTARGAFTSAVARVMASST
jgi:hypothetical protein